MNASFSIHSNLAKDQNRDTEYHYEGPKWESENILNRKRNSQSCERPNENRAWNQAALGDNFEAFNCKDMLLWYNVPHLVAPNVVWKRWYIIHRWPLKYCLGDKLCRMPSFQRGGTFVLPQTVAVPARQSLSQFQPMRPAKCGSCFSVVVLFWPQSLPGHLKL